MRDGPLCQGSFASLAQGSREVKDVLQKSSAHAAFNAPGEFEAVPWDLFALLPTPEWMTLSGFALSRKIECHSPMTRFVSAGLETPVTLCLFLTYFSL